MKNNSLYRAKLALRNYILNNKDKVRAELNRLRNLSKNNKTPKSRRHDIIQKI